MNQGSWLRSGWVALCAAFVMLVLTACGRADLGRPEDFGLPIDGGGGRVTCGDKVCSPEETHASCGDDCWCGDNVCSLDESPPSCPHDCPTHCGNGKCDSGETTSSCPADCLNRPVCGNGKCD